MFDVTARLSISAGYRYVWDESQNWVLPQQGLATLNDGRLRRNVASGGLWFRPFSGLTLNADVEWAASARAYFRTSLNDYQRGGVRARYQAGKDIHLTADLRILNNQNPTAGINPELSVIGCRSVDSGRREAVVIQADYSRLGLRSNIAYFDPADLAARPVPVSRICAQCRSSCRCRTSRPWQSGVKAVVWGFALPVWWYSSHELLPAAWIIIRANPQEPHMVMLMEILRFRPNTPGF